MTRDPEGLLLVAKEYLGRPRVALNDYANEAVNDEEEFRRVPDVPNAMVRDERAMDEELHARVVPMAKFYEDLLFHYFLLLSSKGNFHPDH